MADVTCARTPDLDARQLVELRALCDAAFEGGFADDDWAHALGGWHVVVTDGATPVAHAAVVARDLEVGGRLVRAGYVEAVAVTPGRQGQGLGTLAMAAVADVLVQERFELGALSTGEHRFYERLGWERWCGPTWVRTAAGPVRTEEEDDGVMVLRLPATGPIDLASPISCAARRGDDW